MGGAPVFAGYAVESVTTLPHLSRNACVRVVTYHGSAKNWMEKREHGCEANGSETDKTKTYGDNKMKREEKKQ